MKNTAKKLLLTFVMLCAYHLYAIANEGLKLTFERGTSTTNSMVKITDLQGTPLSGVTASIVTNANSWLTQNSAGAKKVLCPNQNTNASSDNSPLTFTLAISGLGREYSFDSIAITNYALNSTGNYQDPGQGRMRKIIATAGTEESQLSGFSTLTSVNINAGQAKGDSTTIPLTGESIVSSSSLFLKIAISAVDANGCFFGLSGITLSNKSETTGNEPAPEKEEYYTFTSYNGSAFMYEDNGGNLVYGSFDKSIKCYWELIPTGKTNCFYVRNVVSGKYIQSTLAAGSNGAVKLGTTPVEYCIAETPEVGANFFYLVSTDNPSYATISGNNLGLNKGATGVLAYAAGVANKNSFWKRSKSEFLYELKAFSSSEKLGENKYNYLITNSEGLCVEATDNRLELNDKTGAKSQQWYFVGKSNSTGYLIASNRSVNQTVNLVDGKLTIGETTSPTLWCVAAQADGSRFYFRPLTQRNVAGSCLTVGGDTLFSFTGVRNAFSREAQIYQLPCGSTGSNYLTKVSITGQNVSQTLNYSSGSANTSWYTLFVNEKATVSRGTTFNLALTLNSVPTEETDVIAYFDWDRDGTFEVSHRLSGNKEIDKAIDVPAGASLGKTRMRVRVTSNGLLDAEDDVRGETIDFVVNVNDPQAARTVTLSVNSEHRGTVSLSNTAENYPYGAQLTATATAKGNSQFISWCEGKKVLSAEPAYPFLVDHNVNLKAYFSPNTEGGDLLDIKKPMATDNFVYELIHNGDHLEIITDSKVISATIYSPDGKLIKKASTKKISLSGIAKGTYIVKVYTVKKNGSSKVTIK